MKTVVLTFSDNATIAGIRDIVIKAIHDRASAQVPIPAVAVDMADDVQQEAVRNQLLSLGIQITEYTPPAGAQVENGDTVEVSNSDNTFTTNGTADVEGTTLSKVDLPDTHALVHDAQALTIPVTGDYTDTLTLTVADGVVTAAAMS